MRPDDTACMRASPRPAPRPLRGTTARSCASASARDSSGGSRSRSSRRRRKPTRRTSDREPRSPATDARSRVAQAHDGRPAPRCLAGFGRGHEESQPYGSAARTSSRFPSSSTCSPARRSLRPPTSRAERSPGSTDSWRIRGDRRASSSLPVLTRAAADDRPDARFVPARRWVLVPFGGSSNRPGHRVLVPGIGVRVLAPQ